MTLFFCTLLFATHILDPFLKLKISGRPDKLEYLVGVVQIDWAMGFAHAFGNSRMIINRNQKLVAKMTIQLVFVLLKEPTH
jgi:hypothetical protein